MASYIVDPLDWLGPGNIIRKPSSFGHLGIWVVPVCPRRGRPLMLQSLEWKQGKTTTWWFFYLFHALASLSQELEDFQAGEGPQLSTKRSTLPVPSCFRRKQAPVKSFQTGMPSYSYVTTFGWMTQNGWWPGIVVLRMIRLGLWAIANPLFEYSIITRKAAPSL